VLVLSAADVRATADMPSVIAVVRQAYIELSDGRAVVPIRTPITFGEAGITLYMPGYSPGAGAAVMKIVSVFPGNPARGLPTITALAVLTDTETGEPLAIMEAASVTALRTGAASGVATDLLARTGARTLALIGAGAQAHTQLDAILAVRPIESVRVYDRDPSMTAAFVAASAARYPIAFAASATAGDAVDGADVVAAATTSRAPVFPGDRLTPGVHVNGVGSSTLDAQEVGPDAVCRMDKIVVDSRDAAMAEAGDLVVPMRQGLIPETAIYAELGEIAAGRKPGREHENELTLFKTVGVAVLDLFTAKLAYERALATGAGVQVAL
jgi:ornithine cyclodeaminase/alanine dehydrogenase-like protein (mu-crystallin family)